MGRSDHDRSGLDFDGHRLCIRHPRLVDHRHRRAARWGSAVGPGLNGARDRRQTALLLMLDALILKSADTARVHDFAEHTLTEYERTPHAVLAEIRRHLAQRTEQTAYRPAEDAY